MPETTQDLPSLSVLAAIAHPDDESFDCGGTLIMLVDRGARVTLVCATNGEGGDISDPALATRETLAQVRREELRQATEVTGVQDLRFLGYRDSGMAGTVDNNHPNSLCQAEPALVVGQLVSIIREIRPDVVISHDPTGIYGHPDHKAMHSYTTQAFSLAGDVTAYPEYLSQGQHIWTPRLLYYFCVPRSNFRRLWQQMQYAGITPPFSSVDVESMGSPDEEVTIVVDVSAFVDTKLSAQSCHRTQMNPNGPFAQLPPGMWREFMSTEYYILAIPEGADKSVDLLSGL